MPFRNSGGTGGIDDGGQVPRNNAGPDLVHGARVAVQIRQSFLMQILQRKDSHIPRNIQTRFRLEKENVFQ